MPQGKDQSYEDEFLEKKQTCFCDWANIFEGYKEKRREKKDEGKVFE